MSSIGRTRITASQIFSLSAGMIMLAGASHFALQTFDKITQNGPISVNFEEFSWLKNTTLELAQVDEVESASAQNRIELEVSKSQAEISTPRALKKTKPARRAIVRAPQKIIPAQAPMEAPILTSGLDEIPLATLPSEVVQPVETVQPLSELTSLATAEEMISMQKVYLQMRNNFEVATQLKPLKPEMNTQLTVVAESLDAVPAVTNEADLSADEEAFLAAYEASAVIVDDEIAPPAPAALVVAENQPARVENILKPNAPFGGKTPAEMKANAGVLDQKIVEKTAEKTKLIQTALIDDVPEFIKPAKAETKIPPTAVAEAKKENHDEIKVVQSVARKAASSTDLESDWAAYEQDLSAALTTHRDTEGEYPKNPVRQQTQATVSTQPLSSLKALRESASTVIAQNTIRSSSFNHATPRGKAPIAGLGTAEIARADAVNVGEQKGVKKDDRGITIAWDEHESLDDAESLLDSDVGTSFQIGKPGKVASLTKSEPTNEKPILDPKRFCDSALIGKEALLVVANEEPLSVCRRSISFEGPKGSQSRWWEVRESTSHWPTLIWQKESQAFTEKYRIPMLSLNTVRLLSALSKSEAHASAGIVFGEIPSGLEIALSGRADSALYFDRTMKPIAASEVSQARYFAFLNVAPGNPLLYVSSRGGTQSAAISILVQAGHGTYIPVPSPKLIKLKSTVYDAGSARPRAVSSLSVQVIGQDGKAAVTNTQGQFEITDVVSFGDYPLYLDVAPNEQSFKHRYRINPEAPIAKDLFYFNESTVGNWVSQLEGGVSPASGLIVGAVTQLIQEKNATVKVGALEKKTSLSPEVYGIASGDELVANPKLGQNQIRFVGVQISEGVNIPSVFNAQGEMIWSELVIAQPGVINVVGP